MIRKIILFIGLLLFPSLLFSQSFGNEWINYAQKYYRIKVADNGIYRINKQALINSGFPVDAINPKNIQIFGIEKELSIYIKGEEDGSFDDTDFIEFAGYKNDGHLDSLLYDHPADMLNPEYSLINDTLIYYLTWNGSVNNRRVIPESAQNFDSYPSSPFCWVSKQNIFYNHYLSGKRAGQIQNPLYTIGEGYGIFRSSGNYTVEFNTANRITGLSTPDAIFKAVFASANNPTPGIPEGNHHLRVQVQNQIVFDEIFLGYENFNLQSAIDPLTLTNTSQVIFGSVNDIGLTSNDSYAIGYAELTFAHNYNFEGAGLFEFGAVTNSGFDKLKVEFNSFSGNNPVVYAFGNNVYRILASVNGSGFRFLVPQNNEEPINCFVSSTDQIRLVNSLEPVNETGFFTNFAEQNLNNAFIIITANTIKMAAQYYADYRNARFNSLVVLVDELYDQYGGGIKKHPMSIRRFMADLIQNWDTAPSYLFLFGKSIRSSNIRHNPGNFATCLVPTIGAPASDNMFTAGLNGTILQTAIPTGRLAAKSNTISLEYLNKVILFESHQPEMWMKEMLHFGGGGNTNEQTTFANYLSHYETTVTDTSFGAHVNTVLKNTSAPIQINVSEEITNRINAGVSMMTFFGHASGSGFDINIDAPENYENYGKYPLILASSCFVGNVHTTGFSNSEDFVLIPEKGSIAYIASTTTGVAAYLDAFNKKFFKRLFQSDYGTSIGKNLSSAVADIQGNGSDALMIANCLEMTLHGDPSLVLNAFEKPDFATTGNRIFFEPEELTADIDSFKVKIPMDNLARATHQKYNVELIRHFPNNSGDSIYVKPVSGLLNTDTLTFTLAAHHEIADGLNTFDITLDIYEQVDEIDNIGNNKVFAKEYFVRSSQIVPVYPYNQSIISEQQPFLSASTGDLKSEVKSYRFQISQQADFSGNPVEGEVSISGGVVKWKVPFSLNAETVYYWRVAEASDAEEGNWRFSSFEYIPDKTGWGQSSPDQFGTGQFDLLNYNIFQNELSFLEGSKLLTCNVFGGRHINANEVKLDLDLVDYGGCAGGPYIFVMVFDKNTLDAWGTNYGGANPENDFGNVICNSRGRVEKFFAFNQNSDAQMDALYNMLSVEIPNGYHMLVYTYTFSRFDKWSEFNPGLFTLFQNLGSTLIDVTAPEQVPFIFYVQKGMTETVVEEMGQTKFDTLYVSVPLPITGDNGKIEFTGGGFTSKIQGINWSFTEPDDHDKFEFEIHQEHSGEQIHLFETNSPSGNETTPITTDPNLQISGSIKLTDTADFTPLQFEHFRLFYSAVGDIALNPNETFVFESDTVQEGQQLLLEMAITNPTPYPMDSLTIRYTIVDIYNEPVRIVTRKLDSLLPDQTQTDHLEIATLGLSGRNRLVYQINPLSAEGNPEQPEQHRFNNEISIPFFVKTDKTQPILDVVFDGIHIMDGEIVSSKPNVVVSLKDDNDFLVFEEDADTSNINLFVTNPEGVQKRINYGTNDAGDIAWKFDSNKNRFRINYAPEFIDDGKYHLLIQARDKSGNLSGSNDYEITFEVINKSAITQVINYPNPFTTKTYFVFTLTGDRIPDIFTIRIYTVSGKIVKEIHKEELGNIHIGNNITDYYWDGTDNYGDRLANGVYFYQVTVKFNDAIIESIKSNADNYFKSGMGKMYLMR